MSKHICRMHFFLLEYSKVVSLHKLVTEEDYLILIDLVSGLVPAPGLSSCSTLILKEKKGFQNGQEDKKGYKRHFWGTYMYACWSFPDLSIQNHSFILFLDILFWICIGLACIRGKTYSHLFTWICVSRFFSLWFCLNNICSGFSNILFVAVEDLDSQAIIPFLGSSKVKQKKNIVIQTNLLKNLKVSKCPNLWWSFH